MIHAAYLERPMVKPALLACLLLATAQAPAAAPDGQEADIATIQAATRLTNDGKPDEALRLIDPTLARLEADAAKIRGRVYSAQTPVQTLAYMAMASNDKVSATDVGPALGRATFIKAYALIELKRGMEAKPLLDRAVELSPLSSQYLCELASWNAVRKQADHALDLYDRCLDSAGTGPEDVRDRFKAAALRGKGFVLIDLDRLDEAEKAERESLKFEPNHPVALKELDYIAQQRAHPGRNKT
jgi:tetratricopeptide (TPR) repeat protein